ncbi:hypothetical protein RHSIM_Rhsim03G0197900 [Rhododendron simsii]|uniref:Uncharacterized protein n=1 Tax=Rhododendron simsii TaxID=118357 RepID=A0A834LT37_RHOSS|nr:hypothetical protein RHSIM_Rhsim03G0197900 [Rhododendron simsii]
MAILCSLLVSLGIVAPLIILFVQLPLMSRYSRSSSSSAMRSIILVPASIKASDM